MQAYQWDPILHFLVKDALNEDPLGTSRKVHAPRESLHTEALYWHASAEATTELDGMNPRAPTKSDRSFGTDAQSTRL